MSHTDYTEHLAAYLNEHRDDPLTRQAVEACDRELIMLTNLDLTPAEAELKAGYCPKKRRTPRDCVCMLRLLLLMLLRKVTSITAWINTLRSSPLLAVLTGFDPDDMPGVGTCYDFIDRLVNGPYQTPCDHVSRPADILKFRTTRHLKDNTDDRHNYPSIYDSQAEALVADLLKHADEPRLLTLQTRMENLLVTTGILPSIKSGLLDALDHLNVAGDGSGLETGSSPHGKPVCDCSPDDRRDKVCTHARAYTNSTSQWFYCTGRQRFVYGDRYYHLSVSKHGHDLPLLTRLGIGSEADATLSLKALDDLLNISRDFNLGFTIETFIGDMHHDTYPHCDFFQAKGIDSVVPARADTTVNADRQAEIPRASDGTPSCPSGCPMRRHHYARKSRGVVYHCPAKRFTHRTVGGKRTGLYVFHADQCPTGTDCRPDCCIGYHVTMKSETDPRCYPVIARDSKRFKTLYNQRTTTERLNALNDRYKLDRRSRNASHGVIYLTLANILEHAVARFLDALDRIGSKTALLHQTLTQTLGLAW